MPVDSGISYLSSAGTAPSLEPCRRHHVGDLGYRLLNAVVGSLGILAIGIALGLAGGFIKWMIW